MLRALKDLHGYQIEATDGVIGHVVGAYFDDETWTVRYLVVKTGSWLDAREVLLSPHAFGGLDEQTRRLTARLAKKQVENSPSIDLHKPVSRQHESLMSDYYGWPSYWNLGLWESRIPAMMTAVQANANVPHRPRDDGDPHLRSSREVIGYHLHAIDDTLGHVEDLIVDDETWAIRYLAVDTSNWWPGGHVLISPRWIEAVRWPERLVDLRVTRDVIKHSPTWNPGSPITQEYEGNLLDYYRRRQALSMDPRSNAAPLKPHPPRS